VAAFAWNTQGSRKGSVAKFNFWAKSKNWMSGIQCLTDSQTLEKATLRQNRRKGELPNRACAMAGCVERSNTG